MAKSKNLIWEEQFCFELEFPKPRPLRLWSVDELFQKIDSKMIVDLQEDRRIERKTSRTNAKLLGEYLSMFANTSPDGGIILIGVEDDGTVTGCREVEQAHLNDLERAGDVHCPDARYECKDVHIQNAKEEEDYVIAIRVAHRSDKLVETTALQAFHRRGSSRRKLSEDEKRELRNARGQSDIERERVNLTYPSAFLTGAINDFVAMARELRRHPDTLSNEEVLELRHLGKIVDGKFEPNLACALLFARDPQLVVPGCRIRFMRFAGTEEKSGAEYNLIKDVHIDGTVPELIAAADKFIESQVREFSRLGADNKFYSIPEYPRAAWYEAVVNACVHRSYVLKNMNVFVKMFDDRLVIESPGGFPPPVTPENIYDMHQPRNPYLMEGMFYMQLVLMAHEGTRRIRDYMQKMGLPAPEFSQTEVGASLVQVILRNDIEHRKEFVDSGAFKILGERLSSSLTDYERRIVNFVAENRTINVTQASNLILRRWHYTKKVLKGLVGRDILDHVKDPKIDRDAYAYFVLKKKFSDKIKQPANGS